MTGARIIFAESAASAETREQPLVAPLSDRGSDCRGRRSCRSNWLARGNRPRRLRWALSLRVVRFISRTHEERLEVGDVLAQQRLRPSMLPRRGW